ncbi:hypothetical protein [Nonomuraea salmonea]|uniref:hypothetical protein n=1 Tax=Nonomuraea salmonea TaxID=46181 RepID=UPI0031EA1D52
MDGRPCAEVPGVRRVYTYVTSEEFGEGLLRCPGLDRRVESDGRIFYRLTLAGSCAAPAHDLVLVATDGDGLGNLMREAAAYGMTVFPGLPAAPQRAGKPWEPDLAHTAALNAFTARVLADYRTRFGAAFGGVYQSFELAARARSDRDPIISLYAAQHAVVADALPGKKIVVSPYIDARRGRGFPPSQVPEGIADIAGTRHGLPMAIAVQDGRGTGKVPVHGPHEAEAAVAARLVPVVGAVRNGQAYYGSTASYVEAAAREVPEGVELWVNVEGFEPTPAAGECGRVDPLPLRGRTTKARLDQQVMAAGRHPAKIISYGWDPFFTCQARHDTPSLADDIAAGWQQPIIVAAYRKAVNGRPGVQVEGYNLRGGTLTFGETSVQQEWYARSRLETAWAPYEPTSPLDAGHRHERGRPHQHHPLRDALRGPGFLSVGPASFRSSPRTMEVGRCTDRATSCSSPCQRRPRPPRRVPSRVTRAGGWCWPTARRPGTRTPSPVLARCPTGFCTCPTAGGSSTRSTRRSRCPRAGTAWSGSANTCPAPTGWWPTDGHADMGAGRARHRAGRRGRGGGASGVQGGRAGRARADPGAAVPGGGRGHGGLADGRPAGSRGARRGRAGAVEPGRCSTWHCGGAGAVEPGRCSTRHCGGAGAGESCGGLSDPGPARPAARRPRTFGARRPPHPAVGACQSGGLRRVWPGRLGSPLGRHGRPPLAPGPTPDQRHSPRDRRAERAWRAGRRGPGRGRAGAWGGVA